MFLIVHFVSELLDSARLCIYLVFVVCIHEMILGAILCVFAWCDLECMTSGTYCDLNRHLMFQMKLFFIVLQRM